MLLLVIQVVIVLLERFLFVFEAIKRNTLFAVVVELVWGRIFVESVFVPTLFRRISVSVRVQVVFPIHIIGTIQIIFTSILVDMETVIIEFSVGGRS